MEIPISSISTQSQQPCSVETCSYHQNIIEFLNSIRVAYQIIDEKIIVEQENYSKVDEITDYINLFIDKKKLNTQTTVRNNIFSFYVKYHCEVDNPCTIKTIKTFLQDKVKFTIELHLNNDHKHVKKDSSKEPQNKLLKEKLYLLKRITDQEIKEIHKRKVNQTSYKRKLIRQSNINKTKTRERKAPRN